MQNFITAAATKNEAHQFMVRGDHRFSEKDSAYLVYEWQDRRGRSPLAGVGLPGYGTLGSSGTQHAVANWTHIFSPQWLSEVRVGYSRLKVLNLQEDFDVDVVNRLGIQGLTDVGKTPFNNNAPRLAITGFGGFGGGTSQPQGRAENTYHYVGTRYPNLQNGRQLLPPPLQLVQYLHRSRQLQLRWPLHRQLGRRPALLRCLLPGRRVSNPGPDRWFNPCTLLANGTRRNRQANDTPAWQINAINTFGNVGRTTMRGQTALNVDAGLFRNVNINERISAQFPVEAFNLASRATFLLPIGNAASLAFGTITGAVSSGDFGDQRQFRLALKIGF